MDEGTGNEGWLSDEPFRWNGLGAGIADEGPMGDFFDTEEVRAKIENIHAISELLELEPESVVDIYDIVRDPVAREMFGDKGAMTERELAGRFINLEQGQREDRIGNWIRARDVAIRQEEESFQSPSDEPPTVKSIETADEQNLTRYQLPDGTEVRAAHPMLLNGAAGLAFQELSPDGMTLEQRQKRINDLKRQGVTRMPDLIDGTYMPGQIFLPEYGQLIDRQMEHERRVQAWKTGLVRPRELPGRINSELGRHVELIERVLQNGVFRAEAQSKGIALESPDYLSDRKARDAAELWLVSQPDSPQYLMDKLSRFRNGMVGQVLEGGAGGLGLALEGIGLKAAGGYFKDFAAGMVVLQENDVDPRQNADLSSQIAGGAGSVTGFMLPAGFIGTAGRVAGLSTRTVVVLETLTVAGTGAATNGWDCYTQALADGADEEEARIAGGWGAVAGTSEALPIAKWVHTVGGGRAVQNVITRMLTEGVENGAQSALQNLSNEEIAARIYGKHRAELEAIAGEAGVETITGTMMSFLVSAVGKGRAVFARRKEGEAPGNPEKVPEVTTAIGENTKTEPTSSVKESWRQKVIPESSFEKKEEEVADASRASMESPMGESKESFKTKAKREEMEVDSERGLESNPQDIAKTHEQTKREGESGNIEEPTAQVIGRDDSADLISRQKQLWTKARGVSWFEKTASDATVNPDSNKLVLGHFTSEGVSYSKVARHYNSTYFKIENWDVVTKDLSQEEIWRINETFLLQQIRYGKRIFLSHDPTKTRPGSFYEKEVSFLQKMGYHFNKKNQWTWEAIR